MQWRKRIRIVNVVMVDMTTTVRIVDTTLRVFSNPFRGLGVCLCLKKLGAISRIVAVDMFVEPQVRLVRFQANRAETIRSSYGRHGARGVDNAVGCVCCW